MTKMASLRVLVGSTSGVARKTMPWNATFGFSARSSASLKRWHHICSSSRHFILPSHEYDRRQLSVFRGTLDSDYQLRLRRARLKAAQVAADSKVEEADASDVTGNKLMVEDLPTNENSEQLLRLRHSCAHVMAMAVQKLYPDAQVTIGPWIDNGFYYDFDLKNPLTDKDLKTIQKEMQKIIKRNLPIIREEVSREEATRRIKLINEPYKLEILDSIKDDLITIYHIGEEWWDLCSGPHVETTGKINSKAVKLESVAGAYWRGDEKNAMLQRIYGTAWETPEQLHTYRLMVEEAKRRDHRKIGKELELFSVQETVGGGLVFWHPRGAMSRHLIEDYWKKVHLEREYQLLYTPHIAKVDLWKTSGHFDFYRDNMFDQIAVEEEEYQLKPMNCPFHITIYKDSLRSYRELPIRWAELGTVYRYERSGTLHGLFRVRGFTQDDGHIFCLPNQLEDEIVSTLELMEEIMNKFGFKEFEINLSTRPEKAVGSDEIWDLATSSLKGALVRKNWEYIVDEGGGAFYGPKIDVKIKDAIGRKWQCSTIQVDFNLPERFNLEYTTSDGGKERPIMIHRAIFGSLERFFGILTENFAGDFPLWMAPIQICAKLKERGIRAEVQSGERLGKLIRRAETQKVPLMAIIGEKEIESGTLSVRSKTEGELGALTVEDIIEKVLADT